MLTRPRDQSAQTTAIADEDQTQLDLAAPVEPMANYTIPARRTTPTLLALPPAAYTALAP